MQCGSGTQTLFVLSYCSPVFLRLQYALIFKLIPTLQFEILLFELLLQPMCNIGCNSNSSVIFSKTFLDT